MLYNSTGGVGAWGEMEIHTPPLTVNLYKVDLKVAELIDQLTLVNPNTLIDIV